MTPTFSPNGPELIGMLVPAMLILFVFVIAAVRWCRRHSWSSPKSEAEKRAELAARQKQREGSPPGRVQ